MATPEGKVQDDVRDLAKSLGFWVLRFKVMEMSGFPDLLIVGHGRVGFLEIKKDPNTKPKGLQAYRLKQLRKYGIMADHVGTTEEAEKFIHGLLKS